MADNSPFNPIDPLRRRRAFIAAPAPQMQMPESTGNPPCLPAAIHELQHQPAPLNAPETPENPDDLDDLPVLTEIVSPEAAVSEANPDRFDETLTAILAADLAHSISTRLGVELPGLIEATIEATLDTLQSDLQRGIMAATEAGLKDFIARRQQLRLPLE